MRKLENYKPTRFMQKDSYYDQDAADYAVNFIQCLKHTKGKWAGKPFELIDWQEQIVRDIFGVLKPDGNRQFNTVYVEIPKKQGKRLALDTPIPTPSGFTTMGDLRVGDTVFNENGQPCHVVAKSEVDDTEQAYRLTFRDGSSIVAGENHLWDVEYIYGKTKNVEWTTGEIYRRTMRYRQKYKDDPKLYRRSLVRIPVAKPIQCEEAELPVDPYLYGYWLGNGSSTQPAITVSDRDVEELISYIPYELHSRQHQSVGASEILNYPELKKVLVPTFRDKVIRPEYLRASEEQRWALLQGLIDSDGAISTRKAQSNYVSTILPLAESVRELLWSLGIKNAMTSEPSTRYGVPTGETIYKIRFTTFEDQPTSRLHRKIDRKRERVKPTRSCFHYLEDIEMIPEKVKMQCIQVDSSSHQYLAGPSMVPTHNSELAAAIALFLLFGDGEPSAEVYGAAADRQQAGIVFDVASQMVQMTPALSRRSKILTANKRIINHDNNGFYQVLSAEVGCVLPETEILLADGSIRRADEINAGDELWGFDGTQCVTDTVVSVCKEEPAEVLKISTEDKDSVCVTQGHPFWCQRDGSFDWIPADELKPGDILMLADVKEGTQPELRLSAFSRAEPLGMQETISLEMQTWQSHMTNGFVTHNTKHGLNVSGLVLDEVHVQPNRKLYDVLTQGSGDAREQPLYFLITTAGTDTNSICYELHQKAVDILEGRKIDPTFYPVIYGAAMDDDWTDPEVWKKANPSLGITVTMEKMKAACESAKQNPGEENAFRQLRLCQWVKQSVRWMPMQNWDACAFPVDEYELEGRVCYGGLDLSQTTDITAFVLVFPPRDEYEKYIILPYFWIPEENITLRVNRDHVPYDVWQRQGYLQTTEGNVVHYAYIEDFIEQLGKRFHIREIAFDRWGAVQMVQNLESMGFTVVPFGQGFKDMSPSTKELMKLVLEKKIAHGGHPVLRWMMDNVYIKTDSAGNIKMDKEKSTEKIDGAVATVMALDRAIRKEGQQQGSIYDDRDMYVFG